MNYCKWYLRYCVSKLFNHFSRKYCKRWDKLLNEILLKGDYQVVPNGCSGEVLTIDLNYKGKVYTVWTSNGLYAAGHLYKINGKDVKESQQRLPSFKLQYKLLSMVEDFNKSKLEEEKLKFEKEVYGD